MNQDLEKLKELFDCDQMMCEHIHIELVKKLIKSVITDENLKFIDTCFFIDEDGFRWIRVYTNLYYLEIDETNVKNEKSFRDYLKYKINLKRSGVPNCDYEFD